MRCMLVILMLSSKHDFCCSIREDFKIRSLRFEIKTVFRSILLFQLLYAFCLHCLFFSLNRCIFSSFTCSFSKFNLSLYALFFFYPTLLLLYPLFFKNSLLLFLLSLFFFDSSLLLLLSFNLSSHCFIFLFLILVYLDSLIHFFSFLFCPDGHLLLKRRIELCIKCKLLLFLGELILLLYLIHLFNQLSPFNCLFHIWR